MKFLLVLAALLALTQALPASKKELAGQEIVDFVNSQKDGTWKAELHPRFSKMSIDELKALMGAKERHENPQIHKFTVEPKFNGNAASIPTEFDSRTNWPKCADVIGIIADQSACGSCWAVSSASVMSDRVCIGSDGSVKTPISSNDLISCCSSCGHGCNGGWPDEAFYRWTSQGVVTGSSYKLDQGCKPYPFPECEHHTTGTTYPACPSKIYATPHCENKCQTSYKTNFPSDKTFGQRPAFYNRDVKGTQNEILKNGPVVLTFRVYEDFLTYKSGVYKHTTGQYLGNHAVRAIGWGEENGTPYWLIANSWNEDWGDKGYFKFIRGQNDCQIEKEVSTALYKH